VLKEARSGKISGTLGALSSHLEVEERLERPIAAALGDYLDAVVVESDRSSQQALELLLKKTTRGALLPLQSLVPPDRADSPRNIPGIIGNAADLVKVPPRLRPAVDLLLGRVLIVEDRSQVQRALKDQPLDTRVVTLQGEVFHLTGQILAGNEGRPSTLSRSRQRRTWEEKLDRIQGELKKASREREELEEVLQNLQETRQVRREDLEIHKREEDQIRERRRNAVLEVDQAGQRVDWQKTQRSNLEEEIRQAEGEVEKLRLEVQEMEQQISSLGEQRAALNSSASQISLSEERQELAHWETRQAVVERALADARTRLEERETAHRELSEDLAASRRQLKKFQEEQDWLHDKQSQLEEAEEAIEVEITQLKELIKSTDADLETAEAAQGELRTAEAQARKTLNQAERAFAQAEVRHTRAQDKLEAIQDRISEDLGLVEVDYAEDVSGPTPLPLEGYVEKLPRIDQVPEDLGKTIKEKRAQLRRLGAVNPEARKEYRKVKERFEFMTEQLSDLRKAEADIKEVIAELELLMEREFRKTFDAVAVKFREIFTRLFGGGEGRLVLSDPEDLSRTGVDIEARLPGRRTQGLSLLSGGERSLTAAALIFSLLKISPTPFCVLDEVDAMLDESNVARYRSLLRELSSETQFIVITHNRNTVQVADILYGITMDEDSTSQVLSLKLEEVEEIIQDGV
jgi:chromosome segregation protein